MKTLFDLKKPSRITGLQGKDRLVFFLLCLVTAAIPILYPIIKGHGMYFIEDDFIHETVPFITYLTRMVRHGIDTWSWDMDLGSSTIQAFGYFGYTSPFFWLIAIFPVSWARYLIGPVMLLKYVLACYTGQMFLRRFTKTPKNAVPGALLYAFCGFQSVNIVFNNFHEVVVVFPLLLIGLEMMMDENNQDHKVRAGLFFSFAVALNIFVNYFFFVQSVVFLVIYYLIRFSVFKNPKRILKDIPRILGYAFLGAGFSALVWMPNYYYIFQNARTEHSVLEKGIFYNLNHFVYMLKGMILPGDIMWDESALLKYYWASTSSYLPFVGLSLVFSYLLKKRDWLFWLAVVCLLLGLTPLTNSMFLLFTTDYQRWWYALIIILTLVSVKVLEEPDEYPLRKGVLIQAVLIVLITAYILVAKDENGASVLYHSFRYFFYVALMIPGMIYIWMMGSHSTQKITRMFHSRSLMIMCIAVFAAVTTTFTEYGYKHVRQMPEDYYITQMKVAEAIPAIEADYRYRNYENIPIFFSTNANTNGIRAYTSTVSSSLAKLDNILDFYSTHLTVYKEMYAGMPALLGARYLLDADIKFGEEFPESVKNSGEPYTTYTAEGIECRIKTYPASMIGYKVTNYITEEEVRSLPAEKRGIALLNAICTPSEEDGEKAGLNHVTAKDVEDLIQKYPEYSEGDALKVSPVISELCDKNNAGHVQNLNRDEKGFSCDTSYEEDSTVFFSIPADEGWHITIDGNKTEFTDSAGLLVLRVPSGKHHIEAEYHTPFFRLGCIVSASVTLAFVVWLIIYSRKKKTAV